MNRVDVTFALVLETRFWSACLRPNASSRNGMMPLNEEYSFLGNCHDNLFEATFLFVHTDQTDQQMIFLILIIRSLSHYLWYLGRINFLPGSYLYY